MLQFHVLSFEGPDGYASAGGLASRVNGLTETLAEFGVETHLWFVGDPALPGCETHGHLHLHRWCQWISRYHPGGVYDGEAGKQREYASTLPRHLMNVLPAHLHDPNAHAVVLAEEWQTVDAVLHLDWLLRRHGMRERVTIFWNANNLCGFECIDWGRLKNAAVLTTVSRYMRLRMLPLGVDPLVIPNGLAATALVTPARSATAAFRHRLAGRFVLAKVARWDPDKRWLLAIDTVGELKRQGWQPLLIARGGMEAHGMDVLGRAAAAGLRVVDRFAPRPGVDGLLEALGDLGDADIVNLRTHLSPDPRRVLYRGADAVLANSAHEPFGLVGLEAMAAGGIACTGSTGEDYVVPGWNALVLQRDDPREFADLFEGLRHDPAERRAIRQRGKVTAQQFAWTHIVRRNLLPRLQHGNGATARDSVGTAWGRDVHALLAATRAPGRPPLPARDTHRATAQVA